MKRIRCPDGNEYDFDDCEIFEAIEFKETQEELALTLFSQSGISVAVLKGGEKICDRK